MMVNQKSLQRCTKIARTNEHLLMLLKRAWFFTLFAL